LNRIELVDPKYIARLITEDPDVPALLVEWISAHNIYDFYAIAGAEAYDKGISEYFEPEINQLAQDLAFQFHRQIGARVMLQVEDIDVFPDKDFWIASGGLASSWDKLFKAYKREGVIPGGKSDRTKLPGYIFRYPNGDVNEWAGTQESIADELSVEDIDSIWKVYRATEKVRYGGTVTSASGVWYTMWNNYKKILPHLLRGTVQQKIIAIDKLFGTTHHDGSVLAYMVKPGETGLPSEPAAEEVLQALNAKFNAETPSDFWDLVGENIRIRINQLLRSHGQETIKFNQSRDENIFVDNPHEDEDEDQTNIERSEQYHAARGAEPECVDKLDGWGKDMQDRKDKYRQDLLEKGYSVGAACELLDDAFKNEGEEFNKEFIRLYGSR